MKLLIATHVQLGIIALMIKWLCQLYALQELIEDWYLKVYIANYAQKELIRLLLV
jgi:hypothetical protein